MEGILKTSQAKSYEEGKRISSDIAMVVIITSMSMLFATLFLGYFIYRVSSTEWPPYGFDKVSILIPSISTLIIALSSLFYFLFEKKFSKLMYTLSIFFGLSFVVSQFFLWNSLQAQDLYSHSGIFGSMIYGFTWIHFGHMLIGLGLVAWIGLYLVKNESLEKIKFRVKNIGKFWHFLGITWLIMYLTLFVF